MDTLLRNHPEISDESKLQRKCGLKGQRNMDTLRNMEGVIQAQCDTDMENIDPATGQEPETMPRRHNATCTRCVVDTVRPANL